MDNQTIEIPIKFAVRLAQLAFRVDPYGLVLGARQMIGFEASINEALKKEKADAASVGEDE